MSEPTTHVVTNDMCQAGIDAWNNTFGSPYTRYAAVFNAMLAIAPTPEVPEKFAGIRVDVGNRGLGDSGDVEGYVEIVDAKGKMVAWFHDGEDDETEQLARAMIAGLARAATIEQQASRIAELEALINSPQTEDFLTAVRMEAAHQVERWGYAHDRSKSAENWFWLVGYLCGKALRAAITGDKHKALHHTISSAACLLNWHAAITHDETGAGVGQDADLRAKNPQDAMAADHHAGIQRSGEGVHA